MIIKSCFLLWTLFLCHCNGISRELSDHEIFSYRKRISNMFNYAYDNYLKYAQEYDELKPITCQGMDTWGSSYLTLIDSLDSLIFFENYTEFQRVADYVVNYIDFDQNINVSVFETNIRVVAGLLSAHLLSYKAGVPLHPGWPCAGPLLNLAKNIAKKLLPAFQTPTGMPYGTINLKYGVPLDETPITCTAGIGTFIVEFGTLSSLTSDPIFEQTALKALYALHATRSKLDLVGNHINVLNGKWTAIESGIGAGIDSFFEYLVKGAILLRMPNLIEYFKIYYKAINKYIKKEDWYFVVHMTNGLVTMPVFQSLESFFPGLLTLIGQIDQAKKSLLNYYQVLKKYGFIPEFYDVCNSEIKRNGYPLRPEFIESLFYLYKATKDPHLRMIAAEIIEAIEYSTKTECGYATVKNVDDHSIEDRMESFFLAETLKYLYLIFNEDNFVYNNGGKGTVINHTHGTCLIDTGGYIFNTEAHLIDIASIDCCRIKSKSENLNNFKDKIDLYTLFDKRNFVKLNSGNKGQKKAFVSEEATKTNKEKDNAQVLSVTKNHYPLNDVTLTAKEEQVVSTVSLTESFNLKPDESAIKITRALENISFDTTLGDSNYVSTIIENRESIEPSPTSQPSSTVFSSLSSYNSIDKTNSLFESSFQFISESSMQHLESQPPVLDNPSDSQYDNYQDNQHDCNLNQTWLNQTYSNADLLLCDSLPFAFNLARYGQVLVRVDN